MSRRTSTRTASARLASTLLSLAAMSVSASANWTVPPKGYKYEQLSICPEASKRYLICQDQMAIFNEAAKKAEAAGRKLLVVFGADWCTWCHVIEGELPKPAYLTHPELKGKFDVVLIAANVKKSGKKYIVPSGQAVEDMLKSRMQVDKPNGFIPFFVVVEPKLSTPVVGLGNGRFAEVVDDKPGYVPEQFRLIMRQVQSQLDEMVKK